MSKLTRREALAVGLVIFVFIIMLSWTLLRIAQGTSSHGITFYDAPAQTRPAINSSAADSSNTPSLPNTSNTSNSTGSTSNGPLLVVHVAGAVRHPGVYRLPNSARNNDAIQMAGGPTSEANTDAINLAAHIEDGTQIYLPTHQQHPDGGANGSSSHISSFNSSASSGSFASSGTAGHSTGSSRPGPGNHKAKGEAKTGGKLTDPNQGAININTASAEELQRIPGIGPSMAARILEFRQELQKQGGRFQAPEDLLQVSGIGEKKFEKMKAYIKTGS